MEALEFQAVIHGGVIDIPKQYQHLTHGKAKVVVYLEDQVKNKSSRKAGSAKGKVFLSEDFEEPLEDFQEYME